MDTDKQSNIVWAVYTEQCVYVKGKGGRGEQCVKSRPKVSVCACGRKVEGAAHARV